MRPQSAQKDHGPASGHAMVAQRPTHHFRAIAAKQRMPLDEEIRLDVWLVEMGRPDECDRLWPLALVSCGMSYVF